MEFLVFNQKTNCLGGFEPKRDFEGFVEEVDFFLRELHQSKISKEIGIVWVIIYKYKELYYYCYYYKPGKNLLLRDSVIL